MPAPGVGFAFLFFANRFFWILNFENFGVQLAGRFLVCLKVRFDVAFSIPEAMDSEWPCCIAVWVVVLCYAFFFSLFRLMRCCWLSFSHSLVNIENRISDHSDIESGFGLCLRSTMDRNSYVPLSPSNCCEELVVHS